ERLQPEVALDPQLVVIAVRRGPDLDALPNIVPMRDALLVGDLIALRRDAAHQWTPLVAAIGDAYPRQHARVQLLRADISVRVQIVEPRALHHVPREEPLRAQHRIL